MYFQRTIDHHLNTWVTEPYRKPLLLRGARQVGKSSAVRQLSAQFEHFIEVNFEETPAVHSIFQGDLNPKKLVANLQVFYNQPIVPGQTLLFFDEVQACPQAISSLRFFYEKMPELHVVAAGSLLEFALQELPSFGVGRIRSLFMYPFSFDEFLSASGASFMLDAKRNAGFENPLPEALHNKLMEMLRLFMAIGGMPEVVAKYIATGNLLESQRVLDDLYLAFRTDFAKYKTRVPPARLADVFEAVLQQTGGKFMFSKAAPSATHQQIKDALELLVLAGLVVPVTHTAANGLPLGAEADPKKRKMMPFDTGLLQRILGLSLPDLLFGDDPEVVNKGALAEVFFGLEYLKYASPFGSNVLYYWHRESPGSNAEVDYVIQQGPDIVPVEVKSSGKGSMQSLRKFLADKKRPYGYRVSLENFSSYDGIKVVPLYALSHLFKQNEF